MDWLEFFDLVVPGFVACAEFGFFLFMRRGLRILSERDHVELEQRFLRTFNRIFPILTGLSVLLILVYALRFKENSVANRAVWAALFFFSAATVSWIWLNQSIQQEITGWDPDRLPENWKSIWNRHAIAQGLRASLQLLGFVLFCVSIAAR